MQAFVCSQFADNDGCRVDVLGPIGGGSGLSGASLTRVNVSLKRGDEEILHSLVVKEIPSAMPLGESGRAEAHFYQSIAPMLIDQASDAVIRVPRCHGVALATDSCEHSCHRILLEYVTCAAEMENSAVHSLGWRLGRQLEGLTFAEAEAAVLALARLHAKFWRRRPEGLRDASTILSGFHAMLENAAARVTKEKVQSVIPAMQYDDDNFTPSVVDFVQKASAHYQEMIRSLSSSEHQTMLHMDARAENMFFRNGSNETGTEVDMMLFDWQNVCFGHPSIDLAYFFAGSLGTVDRRTSEAELLAAYFDEFGRLVSPECKYTLAQLKDDYSIATLWPCVWSAITIADFEQILEAGSAHSLTKQSRLRTEAFLRTGSLRYLQTAFDSRCLSGTGMFRGSDSPANGCEDNSALLHALKRLELMDEHDYVDADVCERVVTERFEQPNSLVDLVTFMSKHGANQQCLPELLSSASSRVCCLFVHLKF